MQKLNQLISFVFDRITEIEESEIQDHKELDIYRDMYKVLNEYKETMIQKQDGIVIMRVSPDRFRLLESIYTFEDLLTLKTNLCQH